MSLGTIASISMGIKRVSRTFTERLPNLSFYKKPAPEETLSLEEVVCRNGYDQHERILQKKIDDAKKKLESIQNALDQNRVKNFLFKKESEEVKDSIKTSLLLIHEIEKIINDQSNSNARNNRQTLEFIVGEINESITTIKLEDEIDYSIVKNLSTIFSAITVAVWTYLVNANILTAEHPIGIYIIFSLNLIPLILQISQYSAVQFFRIKNGDSSAIVKIYQSLLPALNDIKEILYEEEINSTLASVQKNCEKIMAQQIEHQGKENTLFQALQKLSHENNQKNYILEEKVMKAAMRDPNLEHEIKKTLVKYGENIKYIYKVFDKYRHETFSESSASCSSASNSFSASLSLV